MKPEHIAEIQSFLLLDFKETWVYHEPLHPDSRDQEGFRLPPLRLKMLIPSHLKPLISALRDNFDIEKQEEALLKELKEFMDGIEILLLSMLQEKDVSRKKTESNGTTRDRRLTRTKSVLDLYERHSFLCDEKMPDFN